MQRKRFVLVVFAVSLSLLVFVFGRPLVVRVVSPLWSAENSLSTRLRIFAELVRSKESLAAENEALKHQLATHTTLLSAYRTLESSRDDLLKNFNRAKPNSDIAAAVLVHPPQTPYDVLIIDAGASEGVREGMRVSLPEGGALGVVSEVFAHQSRVNLYTGGSEETQAILERGNVPVLLQGKGGGTFMIEAPRDVVAAVGDKVLLPGIRSELVATVEQVSIEPTDSVVRITAGGVGNIFGLRYVVVH